ncbi:MAG: SctF chaperone SctG, partial [Chlamydiota bacterium]
MTTWKKYKDDFFLLLEGGFIAVNQADEDAALKLFRTTELLDPENIMSKIGFGYLHLHKLELKQ